MQSIIKSTPFHQATKIIFVLQFLTSRPRLVELANVEHRSKQKGTRVSESEGNRKGIDPSQIIGVTKEPVKRTRNIDPRHETRGPVTDLNNSFNPHYSLRNAVSSCAFTMHIGNFYDRHLAGKGENV